MLQLRIHLQCSTLQGYVLCNLVQSSSRRLVGCFLKPTVTRRCMQLRQSGIVSCIPRATRDIHEETTDAASAELAHLGRLYSPSFNTDIS